MTVIRAIGTIPLNLAPISSMESPLSGSDHPRYLEHRGRLIPPQVQDASEQFESLLQKYVIPFEQHGSDYLIYGYR